MRAPLVASLILLGCGGTQTVPAATLGERQFSNPSLSTSPFNALSCSTCHQVAKSPAARNDPGFNLYDVVHRPTWWGGYETTLLDAINYCMTEFMGGRALAPDSDSARELYEYLAANSPDAPALALPLTVVKNVTGLTNLTADKTHGKDVYDRSCRRCHGDPHTGNGRLSSKVSIIPDATLASFPTNAREVAVEKVRHGRFFNIGGIMPIYPAESISDQEIADVLAYLGL